VRIFSDRLVGAIRNERAPGARDIVSPDSSSNVGYFSDCIEY